MGDQWISAERPGPKQHGVPEIIELRQMGFPVDLGDLVEDMAERAVGADFAIEGIDEFHDIGTAQDVRLYGSGMHFQ